jgi:hypothetical protein
MRRCAAGAVFGDRAAGHTRTIAPLDISLPATPAAPSDARAAITTWLAGRAAGRVTDRRRPAASQRARDHRHAGIADGAAIRLSASLRPATLRLEVTDTGTEGTVAAARPAGRTGRAASGSSWSPRSRARDLVERDTRGTTVWLELAAVESGGLREG